MRTEVCGGTIVVVHTGSGTHADARRLCGEVVAHAGAQPAVRAIFHDAGDLLGVDARYPLPYTELERALNGRVEVVACYIPRGWLRALARTVSVVSGRNHWHFFDTREGAVAFLEAAGHWRPAPKRPLSAVASPALPRR